MSVQQGQHPEFGMEIPAYPAIRKDKGIIESYAMEGESELEPRSMAMVNGRKLPFRPTIRRHALHPSDQRAHVRMQGPAGGWPTCHM